MVDRHFLHIRAVPLGNPVSHPVVERQEPFIDRAHGQRRGRHHLGEGREIEDGVTLDGGCVVVIAESPEGRTPQHRLSPADLDRCARKRTGVNAAAQQKGRGGEEVHARSSAGEVTRATTDVIAAPANAYHVHAVAPDVQIHKRAATPASIPVSMPRGPVRLESTPTRNAPSTGPAASESTASPESRTERVTNCAPSATAIWATPQRIVACLDTRISVDSSASGRTYFT